MASIPLHDRAAQRTAQLSRLLQSYLKGDRSPKSAADGKLFLEAISTQDDRVACVERLITSKNALEALKLALRLDVTPSFFNNALKDFLNFLQHPSVAQVCGGELLKRILTIIVRPETLWTSLVSAHSEGKLTPGGELSFAWLLLELISWVENPPINVESIAQDLTERRTLLDSQDGDLRKLGYRIDHILKAKSSEVRQTDFGPGGRHDNDRTDFRDVSIFPTNDELTSTDLAFYRPANAVSQQPFAERPGVHLDNQFRLLREDFLAELREDVNAFRSHGKSRKQPLQLQGLSLAGAHFGAGKFRTPFALMVSVKAGLGGFTQMDTAQRKAYLKANPKFLKDQSFGCVVDQNRIVTFAILLHVEELLVECHGDEVSVVLRAPDTGSLEKLLSTLKSSNTAKFILIDTPVFAYEPVLRCLQSMAEIPLWEELFAISDDEIETAVRPSVVAPLGLINDIEAEKSEIQSLLYLRKPVILDESQLGSLLSGLRQSVSLIQGPPGTGKSFIGALLTKAVIHSTSESILVLTYTNHALDQFLEDLLDIGIPPDYMVRLGAKSTARTQQLQLRNQSFSGRLPYGVIDTMRDEAEDHEGALRPLISSLTNFKPDKRSLMDHLEFSESDSDFFFAFQLPGLDPEETIMGRSGRRVTEHYLYDRWRNGQDAGVFQGGVLSEHSYIWIMDKTTRTEKIKTWNQQLMAERISGIGSLVDSYNRSENTLREAWGQKNAEIIQEKRIIACTTTAAAKYTKHIRNAAPSIIMVEEAGEILESHILTAMTPATKQLVLIGDHQQLRPKINNYALTVEKGDGFDLNRSLFERLILAGFPHTTLSQQHRMCPEISSLVRQLTYPDLRDAPSTVNREPLKGIYSRVVFIDHRHPEVAASQLADRRDQGASVSKENIWEAAMILKIVRYMAQQGYGATQQVVLTPYLGQLNLLRQELAKENDPVLNDLDSFDLIKAGLMTFASTAPSKRPIRLSTIGKSIKSSNYIVADILQTIIKERNLT